MSTLPAIPPGLPGSVAMVCAPGDFVTGGGFEMFGPSLGVVNANIPIPPDTWFVEVLNTAATPIALDGYAICADLAP
jgi:hypothetical protein